MNRYSMILLCCFALLHTVGKAQNTTPDANSVMKLAYQQASKEKKKVFLMFHASWCGWCKKMDKSMQDESCKSFFDKNFVIVHLTVQEGAGKKHLENEGAEALMEKYQGKGQGLPFWVVLDKKGNMLGNALMENGSNVGCPAQPEEVEAFIAVLKKTTKLSQTDEETIGKIFRKNAEK